MADEEEGKRCALCGGAVGPDGRTLTPPPPTARRPVLMPSSPVRQVEEINDNLTPVQRFARALKRRDAAAPKQPTGTDKGEEPKK